MVHKIIETPVYYDMTDSYRVVRQESEPLVKIMSYYQIPSGDDTKQKGEAAWKHLQHQAVDDQWVSHLELIGIEVIECHQRHPADWRTAPFDIIIEYWTVYTQSFYNAMIITK